MRILHTSDWHLGRMLHGRRRYAEFEAFLDWLAAAIRDLRVDALVVAGDVFDSAAPGNQAQELYYRFLRGMADSPCRHAVVVAGNHDSPSFLDAPRGLLKALNIHVAGGAAASPEDDVVVLRDGAGKPELIVCAVPYLRDRDVRLAEAGESADEKELKTLDGIRERYAAVARIAERERGESGSRVPVVATGHLFAAGGRTADGDGVRDLYVGSLVHVDVDVFPDAFDYVALGHLHAAQKAGGRENIRYSGSPIPMGFGDAGRKKSVCLVEFRDGGTEVSEIDVPVFRRLESVRGDWDAITARIRELAAAGSPAWIEVAYDGEEAAGELAERLEALEESRALEIVRVRNERVAASILRRLGRDETLADLSETDVFERCLDANEIFGAHREELLFTYREALASLYEDDAAGE